MSSATWAAKAHPTSLTMINNGTYRDPTGTGQWNCGNVAGYGTAPGYAWNQWSATTPPCTNDRFAVRLSYRDSWSPGCCSAESFTPKVWNWGYEPMTVNDHNSFTKLENRVLQRELWSHPFPYSWPTINDN